MVRAATRRIAAAANDHIVVARLRLELLAAELMILGLIRLLRIDAVSSLCVEWEEKQMLPRGAHKNQVRARRQYTDGDNVGKTGSHFYITLRF